MTHIIFFAPYPESLPTIEQVFSERPDRNLITHQVLLDSYNNPLDSLSADAVIARGFTAHALQQTDIPCAELKTSGYDVIYAVEKCISQFKCHKIAIVGAFNMIYGSDEIGNIYDGITIKSFPITEETELEKTLKKAVQEGFEAIVGGHSTVNIAAQLKLPSVMIESGKEAINNAINDAILALNIYRHEKQKSSEISNIMNYSFQGIMSANQSGIVTLANKYCYQIMSDQNGSITGLDISSLFPTIPFQDIINNGHKVISELHHYKNRQLMVNCVPITTNQGNAGCVLTFQKISQIQDDEGKIRKKMHTTGFIAKYKFSDILHQNPYMAGVIRQASDFGVSDSNLLLYGETGTGKELFAQSIHNISHRRNEPFVAINCAALPEDLLESELFGYVEGAFTGAAKGGKMGFFEIAHRGTIFLDEIGDISKKLQNRLLRVLQEREIIRLGNDTVIPIDVRIISATNKNLREEVEKGSFRQDLLYRLDVLELHIPPLRKRGQDLLFIMEHFITLEQERTGCLLKGIHESSRPLLLSYQWPGNIRELRNFCERICILCQKEYAYPEDVLTALPQLDVPAYALSSNSHDMLKQSECDTILDALARNNNNRSATAAYLHIDKSTLWRKMKKYQLL